MMVKMVNMKVKEDEGSFVGEMGDMSEMTSFFKNVVKLQNVGQIAHFG